MALWTAKYPSSAAHTNNLESELYANSHNGTLNCEYTWQTLVLSISNTLSFPDSKPHENKGRLGCELTAIACSFGDTNS